MKKVIAAIVFFALALSLCACGALKGISELKNAADSLKDLAGEAISGAAGTQAAEKTSPETSPEINFDSIRSSGDSGGETLGKLSEAEKQELIAQGKLAGIDVSFGNDGSTTLVYSDGSTMLQNADGTWVIKGANGNISQWGGNWPDNEFTKKLPTPELGKLLMAVTESTTFTASFEGTDLAQMKTFVNKASEMGYNLEPQTQEQDGDDAFYMYTAANSDGWNLSVMSSNGNHVVTITKP